MPLIFLNLRRSLLAAGVVLVVVAAALLAVRYGPSATVYVSPAVSEETVTKTISIASNVDSPDFVHFVLPATVVTKTIKESKTITRG